MNIEISNPEIEAFIHKRLESDAFKSIEEVLFRALECQDAEEAWQVLHCQEISEKSIKPWLKWNVVRGMTPEQSKAWLDDRKAERKLRQLSR